MKPWLTILSIVGSIWLTQIEAISSFAPQIAIDSAGNSLAVWEKGDGSSPPIIQSDSLPFGGSWAGATTLSDPAKNSCAPTIAMNNNGDAVVLWVSSDVGGAEFANLYASMRPAGGSWSTPTIISSGLREVFNGRLRFDELKEKVEIDVFNCRMRLTDLGYKVEINDSGNIVAAWIELMDTDLAIFSATASISTGSWDSAVQLSTP